MERLNKENVVIVKEYLVKLEDTIDNSKIADIIGQVTIAYNVLNLTLPITKPLQIGDLISLTKEVQLFKDRRLSTLNLERYIAGMMALYHGYVTKWTRNIDPFEEDTDHTIFLETIMGNILVDHPDSIPDDIFNDDLNFPAWIHFYGEEEFTYRDDLMDFSRMSILAGTAQKESELYPDSNESLFSAALAVGDTHLIQMLLNNGFKPDKLEVYITFYNDLQFSSLFYKNWSIQEPLSIMRIFIGEYFYNILNFVIPIKVDYTIIKHVVSLFPKVISAYLSWAKEALTHPHSFPEIKIRQFLNEAGIEF